MMFFLLVFIILLGIVGSLSAMKKEEILSKKAPVSSLGGLRAEDFEIIEIKDN